MTSLRAVPALVTILSLTAVGKLPAESPKQVVEQFLNRSEFAAALQYLDQAETGNLSPEEKAIIPLERAATLNLMAHRETQPKLAMRLLDRAYENLENFRKNNPEHPESLRAKQATAEVLSRRGMRGISQARAPNQDADRPELYKRAGEDLTQAKALYDELIQKYAADFKAFPERIDPMQDLDKYTQKSQAGNRLSATEFEGAIAEFEIALTIDQSLPEHRHQLRTAADRFETVYRNFPKKSAGLYARMFQAKTYEKLGDLQQAVDIYDELLNLDRIPSGTGGVQHDAVRLKLACLNSFPRVDYQRIDQVASDWLIKNPTLRTNRFGLGIQFELARALEAWANDEQANLSTDKQLLHRKRALALVGPVADSQEDFRDDARAMVTRLRTKLDREEPQ